MSSDRTTRIVDAATGQQDTIAALTELIAKFERGEINCAALRLFRPDGTWEDVVVGGDEEQRAAALEDLHNMHKHGH